VSPKTDPNPTAARRTGISRKLVDAQLCCARAKTGSSSREMRSLIVDGYLSRRVSRARSPDDRDGLTPESRWRDRSRRHLTPVPPRQCKFESENPAPKPLCACGHGHCRSVAKLRKPDAERIGWRAWARSCAAPPRLSDHLVSLQIWINKTHGRNSPTVAVTTSLPREPATTPRVWRLARKQREGDASQY